MVDSEYYIRIIHIHMYMYLHTYVYHTTPVHELFRSESVQIDVILGCCDGVQTLPDLGQIRHLEINSIPLSFKGHPTQL